MALELSGETTRCDYKVQVGRDKPKNWLKCVSAFANSEGGTVYFGVDDDGNVTGVDDAKGDIEYISQMIQSRIDPSVRYQLDAIDEDGKTVIALDVPASVHVPHYYTADGRREAFVRSGDRCEGASASQLNDMILRGTNRTWDMLDSGA